MTHLIPPQASEKEAWSLDQWLTYLEQVHPSNIELGLERVAEVFCNLQLNLSQRTIITVAGTNGKGTTCAFIEQALLTSKYTVAVFSSPHLLDYRERLRVAGAMLPEKAHCQAFLKVDQARGDTLLTYFEFGTLAAMQLMADSHADYLLLEVGLGGRLDAVNIVDATIAVITSIDLDHQDWLGHTKELIAIEKAGIFRANIPAVIGEPHPPTTLVNAALDYQVKPLWQGSDFQYQIDAEGFHWQGVNSCYEHLPVPNIPAQNASTALQVIEILGLQLDNRQMAQVIYQTRLPGRRQVIHNTPTVILDVAHNPQATRLLAIDINNMKYKRVIAVVGMLADKDIEATLAPMFSVISIWYCATLGVPRGAQSSRLVSAVLSSKQKVLEYGSVEAAYRCALEKAEKDDLVVVFGSFFTVTNVLKMAALTPHEKV
ncbi:bifunctional tetrahydrofolate synthase/dihydrofolate synthase [Paraglaciecola sp. MB-3u-78]|uniref:bifunctional tetrahydrofolate synthase/dihydrofolate synthase n=1 Tax=Paraglaciecola sp. MB-3u-78 TaxID=2058332 RepID=UPI000C3204AD|nr:bifunctional tetrahydrofolate synthase/dihydrofolate synthase [Paraglaciecola sp. MB-3u-78]PKG99115.1 bifunctional tetrahydrofolate synthase/dihydrofolate synthase [Paraglaciecola sp. MB-3u-78]